MKRTFKLVAMAFIASIATMACTDEISKLSFSVGEDGVSEVSINRLGGCISVPVQANGKWTASIPEDCEWVGLGTKSGENSGKLDLYVDYANPTYIKADRTTQLTVTMGDESKVLNVRQYMGIVDGQNIAYNDSTGFNDLYMTRGLGQGAEIAPTSAAELVKYSIFTKQSLDNLVQKNPAYSNIVTEETRPEIIGTAGPVEKYEDTYSSLDVYISIDVTYKLFTLKVEGDYKMGNWSDIQNYAFDAGYQIPRVQATVQTPDLEAIIDNDELAAVAFTPGFLKVRQDVIDALDKANLDDNTLDRMADADSLAWANAPRSVRNAFSKLNTSYGPLYVAQATIGGDLTIHIQCDTTSVMDTTIVSGSIATAIENALLKVDVEAEVTYKDIAANTLKSGAYTFMVRGGSNSTQMAINNAMGMDQAKINLETIRTAMNEWIESIPTDLDSEEAFKQLSAYKLGYATIWGLFPADISDVVRGYFVNFYRNIKTTVDLSKLN